MLTIYRGKRPIDRRAFLSAGSLGTSGLTLSALLAGEFAADNSGLSKLRVAPSLTTIAKLAEHPPIPELFT